MTTQNTIDESTVQTMDHFAEDAYSLRKRVERFTSAYAWTEDPRSRVRHFVTNVRTFATEASNEFRVESAVLVFRSRGDRNEPNILSAGRCDRLRRTDAGLRLAERIIEADEAVLRMQNLAIFL